MSHRTNIHVFNYKVERLTNDLKRNRPELDISGLICAFDKIRDKIKSSIDFNEYDLIKLNMLNKVK